MHEADTARQVVTPGRIATAVEVFAVVAVFLAVFALHARWMFGHFSNDGYLCDSGWLAFLFEQADPWLRNPQAVVGRACAGVNAPTFLAHHLSPHIFLFGAPLKWLGRSGIDIFAYHQGFFFGLFFVALSITVLTARLPKWDRGLASLAVLALGTIANPVLQAAAYPHYESAMFALSAMAVAAWSANYQRLFAGCLVWLPLIREDGGLYAAVVCLAALAIGSGDERRSEPRTRILVLLACIGIAVSAVAFVAKAIYFPGFEAFSKNFAGDRWSHITFRFAMERIRTTLTNWNVAPMLAGSLVLAAFDWRYLVGSVLLAPLLLLHMLSVRPEHGHLTLYYALPFLLPVLLWIVILVRRIEAGESALTEKVLILVISLALTAPVQALLGTTEQHWIVMKQALARPIANISAMKTLARGVRSSYRSAAVSHGERQCVSTGIAALIPDDLTPDELVDPKSDLRDCRTLLLLREDMHYVALSAKAHVVGFKQVMVREHAEVWLKVED